MTMHLVRGMTTTSTRKRKSKKPNQSQLAAQAKHDKWLRKMGVHPDQLKTKEKSSVHSVPNYSEDRPKISTSDVICAIAPKKKRNEYTGDYIVGIATMHKSNLVPVGRGDDVKAYPKMRR